MPKFTFSINIEESLARCLPKAKEYLMKNGVASFRNGTVSTSDTFAWALRTALEVIKVECPEEEEAIEFVDSAKLMDEVDLCRILSSKDFQILEKYKDEGFRERMDVFDYCDLEGIDWRSLLRDDRTNK
jgi:hypothetical protein